MKVGECCYLWPLSALLLLGPAASLAIQVLPASQSQETTHCLRVPQVLPKRVLDAQDEVPVIF